jgi:hypothetical protein
MFGWLKRWLGWESEWEVYRPDERLVYSYHNGERMVRADPLVLYPRLMDVWTDLRHWIIVLDAVDNFGKSKLLDPEEARRKVSEYTRKIFNLKPLKDGLEAEGTLTDEQAFRLLNHFIVYAEWIKKKANRLPTPSSNSVGSTASTAAPSPIGSSSGSGSAGSVPCTAEPTPSLSEPASPTAALTPESGTSELSQTESSGPKCSPPSIS